MLYKTNQQNRQNFQKCHLEEETLVKLTKNMNH